jgi:hypothetical protein
LTGFRGPLKPSSSDVVDALRHLNRRISALADEFVRLSTALEDVEGRVGDLEAGEEELDARG